MTNDELLLIKGELTNDPLNLGLTTAAEDDEGPNILSRNVWKRICAKTKRANSSCLPFSTAASRWLCMLTVDSRPSKDSATASKAAGNGEADTAAAVLSAPP